MREAGGRIVLMDFGAGRRQASTRRWPERRAISRRKSSPARRRRQRAISTAWACCSSTSSRNSYPYEAVDLEQLRRDHADGRRIFLRDLRPDLPDALVDAIERALEQDPARRFATAGAMERALAKPDVAARVVEVCRRCRPRSRPSSLARSSRAGPPDPISIALPCCRSRRP